MTEQAEEKEREKNNEFTYKTNWVDILLALQLSICNLKIVRDLFKIRNKIIKQLEELINQKVEINPKLSFLDAITTLQIKMQNYHNSKEENATLVPRKYTNQEFEKLIFHRQKVAESILTDQTKNRKIYR